MRKEESDPSNKSANEHEHTLSQVTRWLEWIWDLKRLRSFELCLGVNALALVLNENFRKLGCLELWWLGGIYSPQPPSSGWGRLLAMGAPDCPVRHQIGLVHCLVHRHVTQLLGFRSSRPLALLSSCGTGQSGALWLCTLTLSLHCSRVRYFCSRPLRADSRCPLTHRIVRWIIVERACRNPRLAGLSCTVLVHQTLSGAPFLSTLKFLLLLQIGSLTWVFIGLYWTFLHL
jgi:hypothetical protein